MDFVSHIGDIVLLENDEQYLVLNRIEYENDPYLLVCSDPSLVEPKMEFRFVKEVVRDGQYMIVLENNKKKVANLFKKLEKEIKK